MNYGTATVDVMTEFPASVAEGTTSLSKTSFATFCNSLKLSPVAPVFVTTISSISSTSFQVFTLAALNAIIPAVTGRSFFPAFSKPCPTF